MQRVLERDPRTNAPRYVTKNVTTPSTSTMPTGWSQLKGYYVPQFTATTKLSPEQQKLLNKTQAAQLNLADLATSQSAFLKKYLATPLDINKSLGKFTLDNPTVEGRLIQLGRRRLDPLFAERQSALEQRLADQGIAIGSEAYRTANKQESEGRNDAYDNLILTGHGQAINELLAGRRQSVDELLAQRNAPINEITALLSGSQVTNPTWAPATMPTIPTTDIAGLINENFNQKMGIAQQKNAMSQSILGGLFGLGGKLIGLSDRRAKKDIVKVGKVDDLNLYRYRYKGEDKSTPKHLGVMAQEVEKVKPEAVINGGKFKLVDYGKALLEAA